ncbi:MAG: PIN domain-containing protein [Verrucomicrobiota bacterium]
MNPVFADTFYFIAFVNERDAAHRRALAFSRTFSGCIYTTAWILTEVADALADVERRMKVARFIESLRTDPLVRIIPPTRELFERGLALYADRSDKSWSLTDCISFVVMNDEGLSDVLTGDHHFEQAGFNLLLASSL